MVEYANFIVKYANLYPWSVIAQVYPDFSKLTMLMAGLELGLNSEKPRGVKINFFVLSILLCIELLK